MKDRPSRVLGSARWRLVLVCLTINGSILAGIALRNPEYLFDFRLNDSPDALHYIQLGRNLLLEGEYSRVDGPPFPPDFLRTPVYPVLAGSLDLATGPIGIYLTQVALQIGAILMLFRLAAIFFGRRAAVWAGLLVATDLMWATYNFSALTEPLYVFLTLAALAVLLPRLLPPGRVLANRPAALTDLLAGTLLALATLTRPGGLYLPVVLAVAGLWWLGRRAGWRLGVRAAALLLLPSVLLVGGWIVRNQRQFGVAGLTSVEAVGTVYMAGAGAYQLHHGVDRPTAQRMIATEFELPTLLEAQNPWLSELGIAEIDARLRGAAPEVLARYPSDLVLSSLLGLVKGSLSHNVPSLAGLHARAWTAPGLGGLVRLRGAAFGRLFSNHPALIVAFLWQVGHSLATLALALLGLIAALRSAASRPAALTLLLAVAYLAVGMALFGVDAYYRSRMPLLPILFLFAGVGASALLARWRPSGA